MPDPAPRSSLKDVAELAGVSTATVSRVINRTGPVAEATAARVLAAIKELDYVPHIGARGLASNRTNILGAVFPEIGDPFFSVQLRGIEQVVSEHGYALLIYSAHGRKEPEHELFLPLGRHNTDGLIVVTDGLPDSELQRLHKRGFPVVLLHRSPPEGTDIPCVVFENRAGARHVVEHLITQCGHRRIAYLAGEPDNEDSYWREMGYREALEAHGIAVDSGLIGLGAFDDVVAEKTVNRWLAEGVDIDAIFAGDDESARGAIRALRRARLEVPRDVAVAGFDDALLSRYLDPPLTTVRAPIEEAGRIAAEQLIKLIRTSQSDPLTLLPTELVIRESCGYVGRDSLDPADAISGSNDGTGPDDSHAERPIPHLRPEGETS